jgi:AcrR family transcriptional regulator
MACRSALPVYGCQMPRPNYPKTLDRGEASKDRILKAASELFVRQGFSATSVSQIARQCNLTVPPIYYHFGSKLGLFKAVIEHVGSNIVREIEGLPSLSLREALQIMLDRSLANLDARVAGLRLRLLISFQSDENRHELQAIMQEQRRKSIDMLADTFRARLAPDDHARDLRARRMAEAYVSGLQHLCLDQILESHNASTVVRRKRAMLAALFEIIEQNPSDDADL